MPPFLLLTLASGGLAISQVDVIIKILCRQYKAEGSLVSGTGDDGACQELKPVQELYAQFMLHANLLSSILGAISTPFIETISARSSRVKILALTTMGPCLIDILIVTISRYSDQVSVQWVLLGFFLDGICGSFIATNALAHTYITECTAPENRTVLFGYFHGCLFIGATVGPSLGIFINKVSSNQLTIFYVAIVCHLIFFTFLGCVVPDSPRQKDGGVTSDSSPPESQDNCRSGISSRFQAWVRAVKKSRPYALVKILTTHVEGSSGQIRANLLILLLIDSVTSSVATAYMTISIAYTKFRFNWDNVRSTIFVSIEHLTALFTLFVILPLLKKLQTVRERKRQRTVSEDPSSHPPPESLDSTIIRSGVLLQTAGFLGLSLAENGNFFILSSSFAALSAIASPAILSSLTKLVPEQQAGQLLGLVGVLHSVTRIMATAFFEYIYQHTVSQFAPAVLFCMFGTLALALVLSLGVRANGKIYSPTPLTNILVESPFLGFIDC